MSSADVTRTIPFVDLKTQYQALKPRIDEAIASVITRGAFIMGREHDEFERAFGDYIGAPYCLAVASGTDALELALMACGVGPGDEVITVPNTFIATTEAITHCGASIAWVDVDPRTYNMDPAQLERAVTPRTKAIMPVHLYGAPADLDPIVAFARQHGLLLIEDCAQAHGATYKGRRVGTFGDAACFSFYPGKNLGAYGDGGAIVTSRDDVADWIRLLRSHGTREEYVHEIEGYCRRLDTLQAAVLGVKLPHLEAWNRARRRAAARYNERLAGLPDVVTPEVLGDTESVYHLYVVQVPRRDAMRSALSAASIETGIHYPLPLHEQPAYAHLGYAPDAFPVSHRLATGILSLPMFPEITAEQIERVVGIMEGVLAAV